VWFQLAVPASSLGAALPYTTMFIGNAGVYLCLAAWLTVLALVFRTITGWRKGSEQRVRA
jgi:hypothetical protein